MGFTNSSSSNKLTASELKQKELNSSPKAVILTHHHQQDPNHPLSSAHHHHRRSQLSSNSKMNSTTKKSPFKSTTVRPSRVTCRPESQTSQEARNSFLNHRLTLLPSNHTTDKKTILVQEEATTAIYPNKYSNNSLFMKTTQGAATTTSSHGKSSPQKRGDNARSRSIPIRPSSSCSPFPSSSSSSCDQKSQQPIMNADSNPTTTCESAPHPTEQRERVAEEQELADYRDYVMFSRIVNHLVLQKQKGIFPSQAPLRREHDLTLAHIIGTRNGSLDALSSHGNNSHHHEATNHASFFPRHYLLSQTHTDLQDDHDDEHEEEDDDGFADDEASCYFPYYQQASTPGSPPLRPRNWNHQTLRDTLDRTTSTILEDEAIFDLEL